jgi:hypothetical protein
MAKRSLSVDDFASKRMLTSWQVSTALGEMIGQMVAMEKQTRNTGHTWQS